MSAETPVRISGDNFLGLFIQPFPFFQKNNGADKQRGGKQQAFHKKKQKHGNGSLTCKKQQPALCAFRVPYLFHKSFSFRRHLHMVPGGRKQRRRHFFFQQIRSCRLLSLHEFLSKPICLKHPRQSHKDYLPDAERRQKNAEPPRLFFP